MLRCERAQSRRLPNSAVIGSGWNLVHQPVTDSGGTALPLELSLNLRLGQANLARLSARAPWGAASGRSRRLKEARILRLHLPSTGIGRAAASRAGGLSKRGTQRCREALGLGQKAAPALVAAPHLIEKNEAPAGSPTQWGRN